MVALVCYSEKRWSVEEKKNLAKAESDLKKTGVFKLTGLGSFKIQARSARKGVNPKTGESIRIKASKRVAFAASKALRDKMRRAPVPGTQK